VVGSLIYTLLRVFLALRRQLQAQVRQIKRVHWSPGDRMVLAALRERIRRLGWAGPLGEAGDGARLAPRVGAKEVGWLSRPTASWAAADLTRLPSTECADGAREPALGLFPDPRRALEALASDTQLCHVAVHVAI
jgi:hypothetical protein